MGLGRAKYFVDLHLATTRLSYPEPSAPWATMRSARWSKPKRAALRASGPIAAGCSWKDCSRRSQHGSREAWTTRRSMQMPEIKK